MVSACIGGGGGAVAAGRFALWRAAVSAVSLVRGGAKVQPGNAATPPRLARPGARR